MRTRLYLDIDGVINMLSRPPELPPVIVAGYPIVMNVPLVRQFMSLFDEVVWATTWVLHEKALVEMEQFIGLTKRLEVIPTTKEELRAGMWLRSTGKAPAVARHFDADPLEQGATLWIDDMFGELDLDVAHSRAIVTHQPAPHLGAYSFIAKSLDDGRPWRHQSQEYLSVTG